MELVEYENKSRKCQNLHQLLAKMSAMLGTLILYNCLFKNNDESASDSGEISTPTSASRTKLSQHMVFKRVLKAKEYPFDHPNTDLLIIGQLSSALSDIREGVNKVGTVTCYY